MYYAHHISSFSVLGLTPSIFVWAWSNFKCKPEKTVYWRYLPEVLCCLSYVLWKTGTGWTVSCRPITPIPLHRSVLLAPVEYLQQLQHVETHRLLFAAIAMRSSSSLQVTTVHSSLIFPIFFLVSLFVCLYCWFASWCIHHLLSCSFSSIFLAQRFKTSWSTQDCIFVCQEL